VVAQSYPHVKALHILQTVQRPSMEAASRGRLDTYVHVLYMYMYMYGCRGMIHFTTVMFCLMPILVLCFLLSPINLLFLFCPYWICILILLSPTFNVSNTDTSDCPLLRLLLMYMCMQIIPNLSIVFRKKCYQLTMPEYMCHAGMHSYHSKPLH